MKIYSILKYALASAYFLHGNAEKFKLVVLPKEYGGTDAGVVIDNGEPQKMVPSVNGLLWTMDTKKPSQNYYYVVLNGNEVVYAENTNFNLSRTWKGDEKETMNQVFGRKYDTAGSLLKTIPRVYPAPDSYKKYSQLFQEGEVPVMRAIISQADYTTLINDTGANRETEYFGTLDVITPSNVFQFTNITLSLSGMGSRGNKKRPFKINFSEGENDSKQNTELFDRSSFKLRSCVFDATFIKNKLAVDIGSSMGLPTGQASHARFYLNDDPFGLYDLSENLKKKFLRTYFHPNEKKKQTTLGTFYKGISTSTTEGSYQAYLYPEPKAYYTDMYDASIVRADAPGPLADITEIINWIDGLTDTTPEEEIRAKFDVDMFLKYMALEYFICQWDGYLLGGNNYYIYRKVDGTFSLMSFDFDLTFGKWAFYPAETEFHNFALSTKNYGTQGPIRSQLYVKILNREPFKTQLKTIIDEVTSKLYNVEALEPRVNYFKEFLSDDILWDSIVRPKLKTALYEVLTEIDTFTYDESMSAFGYEPTIDDAGILAWVRARSTYIATLDNLTLKANFDNGEVGGLIVQNEKGDTVVDGKLVSNSGNAFIVNTITLVIISLIAILL